MRLLQQTQDAEREQLQDDGHADQHDQQTHLVVDGVEAFQAHGGTVA